MDNKPAHYIFMENTAENIEKEASADSKQLSPFINKVEDWELEAAGKFLLQLYKRQVISRKENWFVLKTCMYQEFDTFLDVPENKGLRERLAQKFGAYNVGNILHRCNFLVNTKRGSLKYRINYEKLFGKEMLNMFDKQHLFHSQIDNDKNDNEEIGAVGGIYADDDWKPLEYIGTDMQLLSEETNTETKWQCDVCQIFFDSLLKYRYHIQDHGVEAHKAYCKPLIKFDNSILNLKFKFSSNGNKICFKVESPMGNQRNLVIEKVILVKPFSLYTLLNSSISLNTSSCNFFVNIRIFNDYEKHALFFVIRDQIKDKMRMVENYHYVHNFNHSMLLPLNKEPVLRSNRPFKRRETLLDYVPNEEWTKPVKNSGGIDDLKKMSSVFADYMNNNKRLTVHNIQGTLKFLLEIEDLHRCFIGSIVQTDVELQNIGNDYIFKITSVQNIFVEHLLSVNDGVFVRLEFKKANKQEDEISLKHLMDSDESFLKYFKAPNYKVFLGQLKRVNNGIIIFSCAQDIKLDQKYTIVIRPSRFILRLQYRALERLHILSTLDMSRFFFPQFVAPQALPHTCLILHNPEIYKDAEQLQAVQNITEGPYREATYIIDGPIGSGKTSVIIESVMQLYERRADTKLLIMAATEGACDVLALPLSKLLNDMNKLKDMARIYSHLFTFESSGDLDDKHLTLLQTSNVYGKHFYPAVDVLCQKRIVICTMNVAGSLALGNFGRDSNGRPLFTHIFVDNATTVSEPEILVSLVNTLSPHASLILAGDRNQMAPIVYSRRAMDLGLGTSLMERLLQYDCYKLDKSATVQSNSVYTCLQHNYRSHPEIVELCCRLFHYKLLSMGNVGILGTFGNWYKLKNPNSPYLIHHVPADNMQVMSDWNLWALDLVLNYIKELIYFGIDDKNVSSQDFGIITNYSWETKFLRDEMNMRGWNGVKIGTLDTFCGNERNIIFCLLTLNSTLSAGIYNAKNLNTMISRAKSLIIFIGNVQSMKKNDYLVNIVTSCSQRKMLIFGENMEDLKESFGSLMVQEESVVKPPPKLNVNYDANKEKQQQKTNQVKAQLQNQPHNKEGKTSNFVRSMKKGNAIHNAPTKKRNNEKLRDLMQESNKRQMNPIENMFKDITTKESVQNKKPISNINVAKTFNQNKSKNQNKNEKKMHPAVASVSGASSATTINKSMDRKNQNVMGKNITTAPPPPYSQLGLYPTLNVAEQRGQQQQQPPNNVTSPVQVSFYFPTQQQLQTPQPQILQQQYQQPPPLLPPPIQPQYQQPPPQQPRFQHQPQFKYQPPPEQQQQHQNQKHNLHQRAQTSQQPNPTQQQNQQFYEQRYFGGTAPPHTSNVGKAQKTSKTDLPPPYELTFETKKPNKHSPDSPKDQCTIC